MGLFGLSLPKKLDNIIGAVQAQVNPFDNGQTYNTVRQGVTPVAARPVAPTMVGDMGYGGYQPPSTIGQIGNFGRGIVGGIVNPISQVGNEFGALGDLLTGNQTAANNILRPGGGLGHQGGVLGGAEANPGAVFIGPQAIQNIKKTAGTAASIAGNLVGPEAGIMRDGTAIQKIIAGSRAGAIGGTVGSAGSQIATTGHVSLLPTIEAAAGGAALGAIPGVVKGGRAYDAAQNQIGAAGKNVNKLNVPEVLTPQEHAKIQANRFKTKENPSPDGTTGLIPSSESAQELGLSHRFNGEAFQKYLNTRPTQGAKPFPTEAEFNKMIPAAPGKKVGGGTGKLVAADVATTDKGVKLNDAEVNTRRNPVKSIRQNVDQGDYGAVVSNEQAISKPIDTIGGQWASTMKKLTPDEQTNFWRSVEKPNDTTHSPQLQQAIKLWRQVDDRIHANSQALGGNTNYLTDHALHPWQLPEEYLNHIINGGNPDKFKGLNSISRKYRTIAEGEKAGLTLDTDAVGEGTRYLQASSAMLRRASLKQDIAQADAGNMTKSHLLDLGNGHSVQVSKEAAKALRGVQAVRTSDNAIIKGARTVNVGLKSTLLSGGQFHPINISLLRAAPTLVATGHPIAAAKGLYGTFRAAFGTEYAQRVIGKAIDDGTVDKAAKIGMPYGGGGYDTTGSFLKGGVGHHTVFEKQMPMMHDQVARSVIADLEKKNVSLDSEAARRAGASGNRLMGFINKEAANISPGVQKAMGDYLLAGQFTPSKIGQVRAAVNPASYKSGGVAGKYAAASVASNVAAASGIILGLGYLVKQKSDDARDMLIRALTDPAVPTPFKDSKGNTQKLRLPGTDTSDISKLLGIKPVRGADGHLSINWSPGNMPQTLQDFARARLAPLPSGVVKVATNSNFSNKPLYDPNAPTGIKVGQAATTLAVGQLPIGVQGAAYTKAVKGVLPQSSRDVLNAGTPGSSPIVKSVGSAFGLSPATDTTVGKGLQTNQYFDQLAKAKTGLTAQDQNTFDVLFNTKKNPVTGKYDNPANVWDSGARATALLDHPNVLAAATKMNQDLAAKGQTIDPLYGKNLTDKQRQTFLSYTAQTEPATKAEMRLENPWINNLNTARSQFFDSLPPGDPNKPKAPIPYPTPSQSVAGLQNQYFGITDPTEKAKFIQANPELATQFAAEDQYNRSVRDAKSLPQYDSYPNPSPAVQKSLDTYEALPKNDGPKGGSKTRSLWIQANPQAWNAITTYLTQTSLYNLQTSAQKAAFQQQGFDQKGLKAISSLGQYDIGKNTDANGNTIYAIAPGSSNGSSIGGYSSGSGGYYQNSGSPRIGGTSGKSINAAQFMKKIPVGGGPRLPHGGARIPRPKSKVTTHKVAIRGRNTKKETQEKPNKKAITLA